MDEINSHTFLKSLIKLSELSDTFKAFLNKFDLQNLDDKELEQIRVVLSKYLLDPSNTIFIAENFPQDLLYLLMLAMDLNGGAFNYENHIRNCFVLSKLLDVHPDVEDFVIKYFEKYPSPFSSLSNDVQLHKRKRTEVNHEINIGDLETVHMIHQFLTKSPTYFKKKWTWSEFMEKYKNHQNNMVKWIYCHCIAIVTNMTEDTLKKFITTKLSEHESDQCSLEVLSQSPKVQDLNSVRINIFETCESSKVTSVTNICGIYLPVVGEPTAESRVKIIEVDSTKENLKKIALGILSNKRINLIGPVGSGKTVLIEHLAAKTGRVLGENFIKIQLGDQTDSKLLLGTYRCTDIPGEFIWQPGVLTQAVIDGSWLLLEDIDSASLDIASLLSSLLENGYLTVPGYRDYVPVNHGFQLFVTQRLLPSFSGYLKNTTAATSLLEKHLLNINIEPLSLTELEYIIKTLHPSLTTITSRIVNIHKYLMENLNLNLSITDRNSRYITTRDLFKWCSRAVVDFDVSSASSGLKLLQDALDVFCYSYSNIEERCKLGKSICSELGIIAEKVDYFFNQHKPLLSLTGSELKSSRATLKLIDYNTDRSGNFCFTRMASCLLERVMCCISANEPVLLVGETGTGKTSTVQFLARSLGQKLIVINMNQQSDSSDLFGGFKPTELKFIIGPIKNEFENLFHSFYDAAENEKFLGHISYCFSKERYSDLVKLMKTCSGAALKRLMSREGEDKTKKKKKRKNIQKGKDESSEMMLTKWSDFLIKLEKLNQQLKYRNALAFTFVEGSLVKAIENGYWVLLDEINLASVETLDCLSGLLEGKHSSISLLERGDKKPIIRHQNFTLFACMNPSTDVGKKNLPAGLRNRFTELFVDEMTDEKDLLMLVNSYLQSVSTNNKTESIVKFYTKVRREAQTTLSDGLGHKPHFSLRSLCRALMIASKNPCGTAARSLYEAFCLSFLTQLDSNSYKIVEGMISKYMIGTEKQVKSVIKQPIPKPSNRNNEYLQFEGYWVAQGDMELDIPENYILTPSVRKNLKDLTRIVSIGQLPVLLQGDTSVGKTSLIAYLAKSSGNKCVRINNHEHTDLQEYIGSYVADVSGKLVFREGVLVEAMRKGHWIILDELNLAPSDVLEALNRVLDDNRELFIPETQQVVKAHPKFMLFATQNPPGTYGGRKMLSRAFRNRFVELHFNEIPAVELETILQQRCLLAPSYAKKIINVMKDLQTRRRGSAAFAGKYGFITLRDLFRWGDRYRLAEKTVKLYDWDQHLADEGYLVLAGKVRKIEEKLEIIEVLKKHLKRDVSPELLFTLSDKTSPVTKKILEKLYQNKEKYPNIVWTFNMRQMAVLVSKALQFFEPVLIVGETGCGKTTICEVIAQNNEQKLVTINCHMHTESSDFIGGLRPVRDHSKEDINKLFEWVDGSLIEAMKEGNLFLSDEISLADDSVLERLNSLLEPERSLLLAEKGIDINNQLNSELIIAHPNFHFIGTMNPGGDYGKKELSPALRNRFTEIWSEPCSDRKDLVDIINHNVKADLIKPFNVSFGEIIMDFMDWFKKQDIGKQFSLTIRDILTWVSFINACSNKISIKDLYLNGAYLTILDGIGSGVLNIEGKEAIDMIKFRCKDFLMQTLNKYKIIEEDINMEIDQEEKYFRIGQFSIPIGIHDGLNLAFSFNAPTTYYNAVRVVRGMQLNKPILLEGSPGVGKTSLITALASATKNKLYRVNLSDQTDISDLFGADLPIEGGKGGQFSWKDGPFLQALKKENWILLDELNLASQSVLEGLNACLDHRGEIFIPELGKRFYVKPGTKFFACQNPIKQGGSRRGLPKSFLNRFTLVYVESLTTDDYIKILESQFNQIPHDLVKKIVDFNSELVKAISGHYFGHVGGPWEYNLRDLTRWCEVIVKDYDKNKEYQPEKFVRLIYANRLRKTEDREAISNIFKKVFGKDADPECSSIYVTVQKAYIGDTWIERETTNCSPDSSEKHFNLLILRHQMSLLRDLCYCVNMNWLAILVGNSGSGKSSVVRTLAGLAGKTLLTLPVTSAMDTSDLLGGFEQTDCTRHLEDLYKQTESLVHTTIHSALLFQDDSSSLKLLKAWERCCETPEPATENSTMAEETKLFVRKLKNLRSVWDEIERDDVGLRVKENLSKLRDRGNKLLAYVKNEGSLNAGGKFEWVDSILIKSLINGNWLLVDNVNLCSPAVLDRLNGLLEPNGVLTISERGINSEGQMVEIRPHKDFRLFFTMNPKNGEISRAMRNRGIELYVLNGDHNGILNSLDVRSMVYSNGIHNDVVIMTLLKIHEFVSDLIIGEKPNIIHLLQSAFLISQQINRGIENEEAMIRAVMDIYFKTRADYEFNTNDAENTIKTKVREILKNESEALDVFDPNSTLKTGDIHLSSTISKIKQQMCMLDKHLEVKKITYYLLSHFYSVTSMQDLKLRYSFLKKYIQNHVEAKFLAQLNETFYKTLQLITWTDIKELPLDKRWLSGMKSHNNTFLILYFLTLKAITENETSKVKGSTILDYIQKIKQNIYSDNINDVVIREITLLLNTFDNYFIETLTAKQNVQLENEQCTQIISSLQWRKHIYSQLQRNIIPNDEYELNNLLLQLHIHYKWFLKYCLEKIMWLPKMEQNENINKIIKKIDIDLKVHFSDVQKIGKHYRKTLLVPLPNVNGEQLKIALIYDKISDVFDLHKATNQKCKIIDIFLKNKDIYTELCALKYKLKSDSKIEKKELKWLQDTSNEFVETDYQNEEKNSDMKFVLMVDYFTLINIYKGRINNDYTLSDVITVPYNLNGVLKRYLETNDERLLYEISTQVSHYLLNPLCTNPSVIGPEYRTSYYNLNYHSPILTYLTTNVLFEENGTINIKFGDYKESCSLYKKFSIIIWNYFYDISMEVYDFIELEQNYILNSYKHFLEDFTKSLGITKVEIIDTKEAINRCIDAIHKRCNNKRNEKSDERDTLVNLLEESNQSINNIITSTNRTEKLIFVTDAYVYLSYLKVLLNSKLPLMDPQIKREIKRKYLANEIDDFRDITYSYEIQNRIYTNDEFSLCPALKQKQKELEDKYDGLKEYLAVRSKTQRYMDILQDIRHAFSTILLSNKFLKDVAEINNSIKAVRMAVVSKKYLSRKDQLPTTYLSSNIQSFCNILNKYRTSYPDVLEPLYSNLLELLYGIKIKETLLKKLHSQYDLQEKKVDLEKVLRNLVAFPHFNQEQTDCIEVTNLYLEKKLLFYNMNSPQLHEYLKCAILEVYNFSVMSSKYRFTKCAHITNHFENLLRRFVTIWNEMQEILEKEQSEAQSLYKYKSSNKTEEEEIEEEFNDLFPTYHDQDFAEFQHDKLDYINKKQKEKEIGIITLDDVKYVYELHKKFMEINTKTLWMDPIYSNESYNHITPLIEKYKFFKLLLERSALALDYELDKKLLSSLAVLINVTKDIGNVDNKKSYKDYNFYYDSNIEEIKDCYYILKDLEREVNKYLIEWPDHPTLQNIKTIITRIFNFDISSPIPRFLTGFEILLTKCHEWEENAHSGVSLKTCLGNITEQIICWRKMELNMWKNALNMTYERLNLPIAKWWCYIYNIIDQFQNNVIAETGLIDAIQKFIIQTNLAEFKNRLDLLKLFHCHCVHLGTSETLQNIFWHAYNYYSQFLPNVTMKIKELRNPIEQKLKDFVKIVRWKDISYWAVKDKLVKTHKNIHKHMREFEKILQQPVQPFLILSVDKHNVTAKPCEEKINYDIYISTMPNITFVNEYGFEENLLGKTNKYFTKSKLLSQTIISLLPYPKLIQNLEDFITDVLKTSAWLQNLEVNKTLPESKQKSQAKNILQQKRRALVDLFKTLSKIGLSYRKGISGSNLKDDLRRYVMKPINLECALENANGSQSNVDKNILKYWCGCESYYLKSLIRLDVLQNVLINPSKDLGPQEVERCKGFPVNLMDEIFDQKEKLIDSGNDLNQLISHMNYFKKLCNAKSFVNIEDFDRLMEALKKTMVILEQYKIILETCPDKSDFGTNLKDIPLLKDTKNVLCYKNEEVWEKAFSLLNDILQKIEMVFAKEVNLNLDVTSIRYIPIDDLAGFESSISNINEMLEKLLSIFGDIPLSNSLKWIIHVISDCRKKLSPSNGDDDFKPHFNAFIRHNEELMKNVLISIQNLYKNTESHESEGAEDKEESIIQLNHLNLLIKEGLFNSLSFLNTKGIIKIMTEMKNNLQKVAPNNYTIFNEAMNNIYPLLDQFLLLYKYIFTQQVASYRISSKINSILLNIFTDLATKGFCIPPEFNDELSKEGASQQSSGMGLGDGEGEKDVSDKIESEDQLEDAKPDGQENNQEEEDKDCKEEEGGIEMSEDFSSKLQDIEKKDGEEQDEDKSDDDDSNAEEQMGDTEPGADQLDKEIWGSDDEDEPPKDDDSKEDEKGGGGQSLNQEQIGAKEDESKEEASDSKQLQDVEMDKELNEEFDDEQIDPYHQNQQEMEEPEAMDLPDDLQLEDGDDKEEENPEENPFDIDEMKDKIPETIPEEKTEETKADNNNSDDGSDKEEGLENAEHSEEKQDGRDDEERDIEQNDDERGTENIISDALDQTNSKSEEIQQPMDVDNSENLSSDKLASNEAKDQNNQDSMDTTEQENKDDSDGQGQCQNEQSEGGHRDTSVSRQITNTSEQRNIESNKRMGESDSNRSLGDTSLPLKKKFKTVHADNEHDDHKKNLDQQHRNSDMYQHVKESKNYKDQVLDAATKEQVEEQKTLHDDKDLDKDENPQSSDDVPMDLDGNTDDITVSDMLKEKSQNIEKEEKISTKQTQHPDGEVLQEIQNVEIEGMVVQTMQVPRGNESFFSHDILSTGTGLVNLCQQDLLNLRQQVEHELATWVQPPTNETAQKTWEEISAVTSSLANHLSEQLRLVLEPTQNSRLRGDFKTGKRINMRKIIPYIASQFRKDKIWLRRTKPAKREYQIVLAIDDSSSMADNHSKELAFESVSLISKALTLLESGELSILSFGEHTQILHRLSDQFTEKSGATLLQKFQFTEKKTYVGQMVNFATEMLNSNPGKSNAVNAKLLVIISDGRGIFSEGETYVHKAIRNAKLSNIFIIFIIIDNPDNNSSILDIRRAVFKSDNSIDVQSYMDTFPFPFYIVLRDINSLPSVLSDALRQWFEMVSNTDK